MLSVDEINSLKDEVYGLRAKNINLASENVSLKSRKEQFVKKLQEITNTTRAEKKLGDRETNKYLTGALIALAEVFNIMEDIENPIEVEDVNN